MGGHIRLMISGAAPIPPYLLEFFHALGLLILEAYGLSENIVPMAFNRPRNFRFGSVGQSLVANDIRLGPDNEVLVRGPGVFAGYYRDAASQAQFTPEGYYCTGDYATVDEEGFLYLLGRKSEIIKTSGGRRIAPAGIEASLRQIDYIDQAVICGDGHKCLIGMLAIDWNLLCRRMEGIDQEDFNGEYPALLAPMRSLILEDITRYTARFPQHEQPAGFLLLRRELSIAEGDITPNLKLRRGAIATKYQADIEALYRAIEDRAAVAPSPSLQQPLLRYG
jgi:long-chain acyl-CoA synthetase